jgi:hypothetical protein
MPKEPNTDKLIKELREIKEQEEKKKNKQLKILIGMLLLALLIFTLSIFDGNKTTTVICGIIALAFAGATIIKILE